MCIRDRIYPYHAQPDGSAFINGHLHSHKINGPLNPDAAAEKMCIRDRLKGGNCKEYTDKGYSGKNTDRPKFQELVRDRCV